MNKKQNGITNWLKMFFGFFMVLIYLGMAVVMALNLMQWSNTPQWTAIRWLIAIVLGAYGLFRCYREINGDHSYGMRIQDDNEDEEYTTYADRLKKIEEENNEKK